MNTVQWIAKNMTVLFIARIASMLFGFFYVMYTARYLGPANYGILAFASALNGIFGVIANFGLDPREVVETTILYGLALSAMSFLSYAGMGSVDYRLAAGTVPGVYIGTHVNSKVERGRVKTVINIVILVIGILVLAKNIY